MRKIWMRRRRRGRRRREYTFKKPTNQPTNQQTNEPTPPKVRHPHTGSEDRTLSTSFRSSRLALRNSPKCVFLVFSIRCRVSVKRGREGAEVSEGEGNTKKKLGNKKNTRKQTRNIHRSGKNLYQPCD
jgi:hypothetical protein